MDPSELEAARRDPRRRLERFLLLAELGRGGMGVVYRAWDEAAGREVALKLLLEDDPTAAERMLREAEAVARLRHPGIVGVHEVGRVAGRPFVAMELVAGRSLEKEPVPFASEDALRLVAALAAAIEHAHAHGVVHRDLKPANVIVDGEGRPRVLDFGLALLGDRSRLTRTGGLLGTPAYMPPEQIGGQADARSDVYALGGVLYWLLTGAAPFAGSSLENVLTAILSSPPRPPRALNPAASPAAEAICLRCLEKEPEARYPSAAALNEAIARALAGEAIAPVRRRPRAAVALSIALLGALGLGLGLTRERAPTRDPQAEAEAALQATDEALARGDHAAALGALPPAEGLDGPRAARRAALAGEERWLAGDLETARAAAPGAGATLELLLGAIDGAPDEVVARLERERPRPSVALATAVALGRRGDFFAADRALATARADPTPLACALLEAGRLDAVAPLLSRTAASALTAVRVAKLADHVLECLRAAPDAMPAHGRPRALDQAWSLVRPLPAALGSRAVAELAGLHEAALGAVDAVELYYGDQEEVRRARYQRALGAYRIARALDPTTPAPDRLLGLEKMLRFHQAPDAASAWKRAVELRDRRGLTRTQRLSQLRALALEVRGLRARREVAFVIAEILADGGDAEAARATMAEACAWPVDADDHDYLVHLAHVTWLAGRRGEASALLDRVIDEDPFFPDARRLRAWFSVDGARELERGLSDLQVASDHRRRHRYGGALQWDTFVLKALLHELRGDLEQAWAACLEYEREREPRYVEKFTREHGARIRAKLEAARVRR